MMINDITFDMNHNDIAGIVQTLKRNGCILLRNALDRKPVQHAGIAVHDNAARLREIVGQDVNDMPLCFADQHCDDPEIVGRDGSTLDSFTDPLTCSRMDRGWYDEGERNYKRWFWNNGSRFPNCILGLIERSKLPEITRQYFTEGSVCPYQYCVVRYQRLDLKHQSYRFHQDGSYHSRKPEDHLGLTIWIPLTDCGEDAPTLQLYPRHIHTILPLPDGVQSPCLFCEEDTVLERFRGKLWQPVMSAGDVLVFDHFVVHRTYITRHMTRERQSADVRLFPKESVPSYVELKPGWVLDFD